MRIALIELIGWTKMLRAPAFMPVYLASVAAVLREDGHDVTIVDRGTCQRLCNWDQDATTKLIVEEVRRFEPEAVLCDLRYQAWPVFQAIASEIKRAIPEVKLLAGGRHGTLAPVDSLKNCDDLDAALVGEPEPAMQKFAAGTSLSEISAFASREGSEPRGRRDLPVEDLDTLPFPAWDLQDMEYYASRTPRVIRCLSLKTSSIESSRGCTAGCRFCAEGRLAAGRHRWHSAEYIANETEQLAADYGIEGVYFTDESFLANRERVVELSEEFIRRRLGDRVLWTAQVRVDSVDPEVLGLMKKAGCVQLEFGVESGSQAVLDSLHKGTTCEANMTGVKMAREAGIRAMTYIMTAVPGETIEDIRETAAFIRAANPNIVRMTEYIPLPGTVTIQRLTRTGNMDPEYWSGSGDMKTHASKQFKNLTAMDEKRCKREVRRIYFLHVFPRYARDFFRHNPPWRLLTMFRPRSLFAFLWSRLSA